MEFTAKARYMRVSPQKVRLVLALIKGKRVEAALNTLAFTNKGIAPAVLKLLRSAVENASYLSAEKGLDVDLDNLYVKNAIANEGPRMKRIRPAPMGRAFRYQRRMAHIEIELAEKKSQAIASTDAGTAAAAPAQKGRSQAGSQEGRCQKDGAEKGKEVGSPLRRTRLSGG